jgi:N-acetyl-gamma-glutamyl-phosphate reductase
MKAGVLGTSGYAGLVLLRLLSCHPGIESVIAVSSSKAGEKADSLDPGLGTEALSKMSSSDGRLVKLEEAVDKKPDVVFAALPHLRSAGLCSRFLGQSIVIDLSADFRIKNTKSFEKAYGAPPPRPDLLKQAVYGLSEWYRERIKTSDLIANPGCYPTALLLPLLPLLGLLRPPVIANALSGISGAGKKASEKLLYCERSENAGAYLPGRSHRHVCEMEEQIIENGGAAGLLFTPHLIPMRRGVHITISAALKSDSSQAAVAEALAEAYESSPFVSLKGDQLPQTGDVWGSNRCDIGWHIEDGTILLFSVIDNLVKGASGQAVQNMNLRFGFNETTGLRCQSEL